MFDSVNKTTYKDWSQSAIDCYNRTGYCKGCINSHLESKCIMYNTVVYLLEKFGEPEEEPPMPTIEEVRKLIKQGVMLKDIADMYGVSKFKFQKFTRSHGINGHKLKKRKNGNWS